MKRLLTFGLPQTVFESKPLEYKEVEGGFEVEMMIFSTAYNRNKAYFQVSDLMKWSKKLDSIMFNFNHDLNLSGGKYLGNQNKFTSLRADYSTGDLEIFATFKTTDPLVVAKKTDITAPSIELMVNEEDCICNEYGEYYTQIDWVGCALLLGIVAGSGNTRVGEIKEFNHLSNFNIIQDMTEDQVKTLLDEQANSLKAEFKAENEQIKKDFAEVVAQSQRVSTSTREWVDPDTGSSYKTTTEEAYRTITELMESGKASDQLLSLMKAKGYQITTPGETAIQDPEPTSEQIEDQETLKQIENSLKKADLIQKFKAEKQVSNRDNDVEKPILTPEFKLRTQVQNNLSNII